MTGDIMKSILATLNHHMHSANCNILLFIENAGYHPEDLCGKFSNIKICFFPANMTSSLQPLDLGIIKNFKLHYFLRYVLLKMEECNTASDVGQLICH